MRVCECVCICVHECTRTHIYTHILVGVMMYVVSAGRLGEAESEFQTSLGYLVSLWLPKAAYCDLVSVNKTTKIHLKRQ